MIGHQLIDYFRLFKIYDQKKLEKTGNVKVTQDKILMRKVLSVEGTVSTENFLPFNCSNHLNVNFRPQYLYLSVFCEPGKSMNFQISYFLSNRQYRVVCSTMYKEQFKRKNDSLFHFQLKVPQGKWTIVVLDLYSLANWDGAFKSDQDVRLGFRISHIEIRGTTRLRGMFQSEALFGPQNLPKDMELPLRNQEDFFDKYSFVVLGLNHTEEIKLIADNIGQKSKSQVENKQKSKDCSPRGTSKAKLKQKKPVTSVSKEKPQAEKRQQQKNSQRKSIQQSKRVEGEASQKSKIVKPIHDFEQDFQVEEQPCLEVPRPAAAISISLKAVEALSAIDFNVVAVESYLIRPVLIETHKTIHRVFKGRKGQVLTAYGDGSVCLWDTVRKQSQFYFRSELEEIKSLLMDHEGNIVIVGLDKLKREVIEIVSDSAIIFKQISTFSIQNIHLVNPESFEFGLITHGFENVRFWTVNPKNNIINGHSVYLGKMSRNITYSDCCVIQTYSHEFYAFVSDSQGYITKINVSDKKMEGAVRVEETEGIDHIRLIEYEGQQKILTCNSKGNIKLLSCSTMESELEYPLNQRIKNLFLKQSISEKGQDCSKLILETYKKTLAELDLEDSTFHFLTRSHHQPVSHLQVGAVSRMDTAKQVSQTEGKVITAGLDSTMRIWKTLKVSEEETVLKEEYEFLINGETISHVVYVDRASSASLSSGLVFIISDSNKIRKINTDNYQIVKEVNLPSGNPEQIDMKVIGLSVNHQGKFLLIVFTGAAIILNNDLEILSIRQFEVGVVGSNFKKDKIKRQSSGNARQQICGFNTHKKSYYYLNPCNQKLEFFQMKNPDEPFLTIDPEVEPSEIVQVEWIKDSLHLATLHEYQMYCEGSLKRVIPFKTKQTHSNSSERSAFEVTSVNMQYPLICRSYSDGTLELGVIGDGYGEICERLKLPERVDNIRLKFPDLLKSLEQEEVSCFFPEISGEIFCSGANSFGIYVVNACLTNLEYKHLSEITVKGRLSQSIFSNGNMANDELSYGNGQPLMQGEGQSAVDISFSETVTQNPYSRMSRHRMSTMPFKSQNSAELPMQLKKIYEEEEKVFEQCKKVVFGNFFDDDSPNQNQDVDEALQECQSQEKQYEEKYANSDSIMNLDSFFGFETRQSPEQTLAVQQTSEFFWRQSEQTMILLTNDYKSLLVHEFSTPISQKLVHLYAKPTSVCWSYASPNHQSEPMLCYFVVCCNSMIRLYNASNKLGYIRSIEIEQLIDQKHVIFDSFVTSCNSFLVLLSYRLAAGNEKRRPIGQIQQSETERMLYIYVVEISSGKIVSSSYRQVRDKLLSRPLIRSGADKCCSSYHLVPNREAVNQQLEFVLFGPSELTFYRVTSMFTMQILQLEEVLPITKQKTETLVSAKYICVDKETYLLVGTQNGSIIIVDSRSGAVILVLVHVLGKGSSSVKVESITGFWLIKESEQQGVSCSRLVMTVLGSSQIYVFCLFNGLNTLIDFLSKSETPITADHSDSLSASNLKTQIPLSSQDSCRFQISQTDSGLRTVDLDSAIHSISNVCGSQCLVITKSSSLWLVDFEDFCSIKISSAHEQNINQIKFLSHVNADSHQKQSDFEPSYDFITCSEDGYVKISNTQRLEQKVEIYKPRKRASCLEVVQSCIACAFNDEIFFYEYDRSPTSKSMHYLGSLQLEGERIISIKNIPSSSNYYILTHSTLYIIYVKRKEDKKNSMKQSQLSLSHSQFSKTSKSQLSGGGTSLQSVSIEIQIKQITQFEQTNCLNSLGSVLWIEINPKRLYDDFAIGYKGGKVDSWQRKCIKRVFNPLESLAKVQSLDYYLVDTYKRKQVLMPTVQFISQNQYLIALSELNRLQIRNYREHSILSEILLPEQSIQGFSCFRYLFDDAEPFSEDKTTNSVGLSRAIKGPKLLVGDDNGYLNICNLNGLIVQKFKVFSSPVRSIELQRGSSQETEIRSNGVKSRLLGILVKSDRFVSVVECLK